jgi:beta-glucosidase
MHFGWENKDDIQREIDEALAAVDGADAVVVCAGFSKQTEGEGWDRSFAMEEDTDRMVAMVAKRNPNTVVVLNAGGNVAMDRWIDSVKGLVHAWYPGQEGGTAVAEVLFGAVNPSGKLPATFEKRLEDRSSFDSYHDRDNDKHVLLSDGVFTGYRHHDKTGVAPRFPFGFGLSYTTFEYRGLRLSANRMTAADTLTVEFDVYNTGSCAGAEVAQVYIADRHCRLPRPVKELKSFAKVMLEPGDAAHVSVDLTVKDLQFYDPAVHGWVSEPGEFEVLVGASSADIRLGGKFVLGGKAEKTAKAEGKAKKSKVAAGPATRAKSKSGVKKDATVAAKAKKGPVKAAAKGKKAKAKPVVKAKKAKGKRR